MLEYGRVPFLALTAIHAVSAKYALISNKALKLADLPYMNEGDASVLASTLLISLTPHKEFRSMIKATLWHAFLHSYSNSRTVQSQRKRQPVDHWKKF